MKRGRYFFEPARDPFFNMAFDEWLFDDILKDTCDCAAFLRLYSWDKPAITIGYNQDPSKAVSREKHNKGIPTIRRITGGRAIFHDPSELTFTLATRLEMLPAGIRSLFATNGLISEVIVEVLKRQGIDSSWARHSDRAFSASPREGGRACFNSLSKYEIVSSGGKIAGGAQRRKSDSFIHQGSLKLNGISECSAIGQRSMGRKTEREGRPTRNYLISEFEHLFPAVFGERLAISFQPSRLAPEESRAVEFLVSELQKNPVEKK